MKIKGICLYKQEANIEDSSRTIINIINSSALGGVIPI